VIFVVFGLFYFVYSIAYTKPNPQTKKNDIERKPVEYDWSKLIWYEEQTFPQNIVNTKPIYHFGEVPLETKQKYTKMCENSNISYAYVSECRAGPNGQVFKGLKPYPMNHSWIKNEFDFSSRICEPLEEAIYLYLPDGFSDIELFFKVFPRLFVLDMSFITSNTIILNKNNDMVEKVLFAMNTKTIVIGQTNDCYMSSFLAVLGYPKTTEIQYPVQTRVLLSQMKSLIKGTPSGNIVYVPKSKSMPQSYLDSIGILSLIDSRIKINYLDGDIWSMIFYFNHANCIILFGSEYVDYSVFMRKKTLLILITSDPYSPKIKMAQENGVYIFIIHVNGEINACTRKTILDILKNVFSESFGFDDEKTSYKIHDPLKCDQETLDDLIKEEQRLQKNQFSGSSNHKVEVITGEKRD